MSRDKRFDRRILVEIFYAIRLAIATYTHKLDATDLSCQAQWNPDLFDWLTNNVTDTPISTNENREARVGKLPASTSNPLFLRPGNSSMKQLSASVIKLMNGDIWLRREFTLGSEDLREAQLQLHHDKDAEIHFNGVLAAQVNGFVTRYYEMSINTDDDDDTLKPGVNRMAVLCHQTQGGQFIDVGILILRAPKTAKPAN